MMENSSLSVRQARHYGSNLPTCISNHRMGFTSASRFRNDLLNLKLRDLHTTRIVKTKLSRLKAYMGNNKRSFACSFVSPAVGSFACSWVIGKYPHQYVFVGIHNENSGKEVLTSETSASGYPLYTREIKFNFMFPNYHIMDITHMDDNANHFDSILIVSQLFNETCSNVEMVPKMQSYPQTQVFHQNSLRLRSRKAYNIVWNSNVQMLSLGTNSGIICSPCDAFFGDASETFCPGEDRQRFERPYVQLFNTRGNLLYFGLHNGHLTCFDLRCPISSFQSDLVIGDALTCLRVLEDDVTMIIGGRNDKLCCLDTRMNSVLFNYPGHLTRGRKTAFHLDAAHGVLCSSGGDHVTRFWDAKGGSLLTERASDFPNEKKLFMYSSVKSSGCRLYCHTFCGNKVRYMETVADL